MQNSKSFNKLIYSFCTMSLMTVLFVFVTLEVKAVTFPGISVSFDTADESVIVEGIPANSADGLVEYQLEGYLNYDKTRVETFCYAPNVKAYDVANKQAYIFNWSGDAEFLLPCSGEYKFTAYVTARYIDAQGNGVEESGPKTTITITLHKEDESTNWGPGLPNTTVETYDLGQIKGKDKTIKVEEPEYTWNIYGKDIISVPEKNVSLKITMNPESFPDDGIEDFFGDTTIFKFNIEHNGEFGFSAVLDYTLGEQYAGKYANLFYVVGDGTFEYINNATVTEDGVATFVFTHASDYVLEIMEEEYTGQELNPQPTEVPQEEQTPGGDVLEAGNADAENVDTETTDMETTEQGEHEEEDAVTVEGEPKSDLESAETHNIPIGFIIGGVVVLAVLTASVLIVRKKRRA